MLYVAYDRQSEIHPPALQWMNFLKRASKNLHGLRDFNYIHNTGGGLPACDLYVSLWDFHISDSPSSSREIISLDEEEVLFLRCVILLWNLEICVPQRPPTPDDVLTAQDDEATPYVVRIYVAYDPESEIHPPALQWQRNACM